jgi:cytidine deaminase
LETYARGDFVIDCSSPQSLTSTSERFVQAFFGYPFISPTRDEYGAYMAYSASLRSADLSRQIGAAIFQPSGEIVSMGCNEVPKFGGGTYWTDDANDARDFRLGLDSNARLKADLIQDTVRHLTEAGWQPPKRIRGDELEGAMVNDLLEFGRVIHAEMNAICDAGRFGRATSGATLYCTTFPCHMCSRHIVAAGINRVVYLEPYHKSLARELYPDSIAFDDGVDRPSGKVTFSSYAGVTPIAFQTVFQKRKRKDSSGKAIDWTPELAVPITRGTTEYLNLEMVALSQLAEIVRPAANEDDVYPNEAGGAQPDHVF